MLIELKDPDGKLFVKERVELARQQPSFWQNYKFINPATKKVEPKEMYCERLSETAVCGGVYKFLIRNLAHRYAIQGFDLTSGFGNNSDLPGCLLCGR